MGWRWMLRLCAALLLSVLPTRAEVLVQQQLVLHQAPSPAPLRGPAWIVREDPSRKFTPKAEDVAGDPNQKNFDIPRRNFPVETEEQIASLNDDLKWALKTKDPMELRYCCDTIHPSEIIDNMPELVMKYGLHELILQGIQMFPDEYTVQMSCQHFLLMVGFGWKKMADWLSEHGFYQIVLQFIKDNEQDNAPREFLGLIAANSMFSKKTRKNMRELGVMDMAADWQDTYSNDPETLTNVFDFWEIYCNDDVNTQETREFIKNSGAITRAVQNMRDHPFHRVTGSSMCFLATCYAERADHFEDMIAAGLIGEWINTINYNKFNFDRMDEMQSPIGFPSCAMHILINMLGMMPKIGKQFIEAGVGDAFVTIVKTVAVFVETNSHFPDFHNRSMTDFTGIMRDPIFQVCVALTSFKNAGYLDFYNDQTVTKEILQKIMRVRFTTDPAQQYCRPHLSDPDVGVPIEEAPDPELAKTFSEILKNSHIEVPEAA